MSELVKALTAIVLIILVCKTKVTGSNPVCRKAHPQLAAIVKVPCLLYSEICRQDNMKQKSSGFYETILAILILAVILLPQLIGTTIVTDETAGVDEDGLPVTTKTFTDLKVPGTKFGTLTIHEWETEILKTLS